MQAVRLIAITKPEDGSKPEDLIAYCARVSNPSNQTNTQTSSKLLNYCIRNQHWSIFEMAHVVLEINTTRDIARQILRHRSFCLGADSVIWFDLPDENSPLKYKPYKRTISYLYDRFHNGAAPLPNGVRMPMKEKICNMRIRCVNEETGEITHTHINDITKSTAILYKVIFDNGNVVTSSMDHKYLTDRGWLTLSQALEVNAKFVAQGLKANQPAQEFPEIDESIEKIDSVVSDIHGRLRTTLTSIVDYECVGEQDSYDISVIGPWHNFICDGQVVHNSFQEFSQRYADASQLGFTIREARLQDTKNRQNSIETEDEDLQKAWIMKQEQLIHESTLAYTWALENGIAKEQARAILPEGNTNSRIYMSGTLRSFIHYCQLRMDNGTQKEHREIAKECWNILQREFPFLKELNNE